MFGNFDYQGHLESMLEPTFQKNAHDDEIDSAHLETRDILKKMQDESTIESEKNTKRFIITTILTVFALAVAVIAATASVLTLVCN